MLSQRCRETVRLKQHAVLLFSMVLSMRLNILEWPCLPHLSYFALRDTFVTLWISCPPKHVMWQHVIRGTGEFKVRNLIQGTGYKIYLRWLSELALFIFATPP